MKAYRPIARRVNSLKLWGLINLQVLTVASLRRGAVKFFSPARNPVDLFALQHFRCTAERPREWSVTPVTLRRLGPGSELVEQENPGRAPLRTQVVVGDTGDASAAWAWL